MLSNRKPAIFSFLLAVALGVGGCGLLGEKGARTRLLQYIPGNAGCMNDAGTRLARFFTGELSDAELAISMDCAVTSLQAFKKFVRGSSPEGYTAEDVRLLVAEVMVTDKPVTIELMRAAFELKSSLIGGRPEVMTMAEIDQVIARLQSMKQITREFLPHLRARTQQPTVRTLIDFMAAGETAAKNLAATVADPSFAALSVGALRTLVVELGPILDMKLDPRWADVALASKQAIAGGSADEIESAAWKVLIAQAGHLLTTGLALVASKADGEVMTASARHLEAALLASIRLHPGGGIPVPIIDRLLANLPEGTTKLSSATSKTLVRMIVNRLFKSGLASTIDGQTAQALAATIADLGAGWNHIERLWERAGLDPNGEMSGRVTQAITDYRLSVDPSEYARVDRLQKLHQTFRPLFAADDKHVSFLYSPKRTLTDLKTIHWINLTAVLLLNGYGSVPKAGGPVAVVEDFQTLITDVRGLALELQVMNPDIPLLNERRFREADLFTYSSNGNDQVDQNEFTYLIAMLTSIGEGGRDVQADIETLCDAGLGEEAIGRKWLTASCFREEFFTRGDQYWARIPELVSHYAGLNASDRATFRKDLEAGTRIDGYTDNPFDAYDVQSMIGGSHYVEALFMRYDLNFDGELDVPELLKATPTFKLMIAKQGKINPKDTSMIEAIFTYIVKHGKPPKEGILGIIDLLSWKLRRPWWDIHAQRNDVYKIISFFNAYK